MIPGMNPNGMNMKLPAEQMSDATARPDVLTGPATAGSRLGGAGGTLAGSATVVLCGLAGAAVATGAEAPGLGTVNRFWQTGHVICEPQ